MTEAGALDLSLGDVSRLEDVVDREALTQLCRSFFELFGLSVRVFAADGTLLADVHEERAICRYVNTLAQGRTACGATVAAVKQLRPESATVLHSCFTGAVYRVVPIDYHGRQVGRFVVGPYLPADTREVPKSLLAVDDGLDPQAARTHLDEMPRVRSDTAERICEHMRGMLDLVLFASHRAHLTSEMHVASVRESYRELAEKNVQLQQAYDRLKELDRLKSNFLATVSHELRTPLTSIIGYSEMLDGGMAGELTDEQKEFVNTIHGKGEHLLKLISSLLDLSKLEQGHLPFEPERLDPEALLDEVVATITPQAQKKSVELRTELDPNLPELSGDPVRIKQILFNLTDNAVKFTPNDGTVHLAAKATELEPEDDDGFGAALMATPRRAIAFSVTDTGIGIPEPECERIFDAFYQIDGSSTREHGGTGLGLSIVRRLVEAHDGTIRVDSTVGKGTTFTVTIPEPDEDAGS